LALGSPSKRFILGDILDSTQTNNLVQQIVDQVGSDATEQQCETQCKAILNSPLLDTACPFVCNSFQAAVHGLNQGGQSKRFILGDILDSTETNKLVQQIVDQVGSDASEQQCETQCMAILNNPLLDTACPFVCNSFQALVNKLNQGGQSKRFILGDILDSTETNKLVQQIVDQVGSDATEQQCEQQCINILNNELLETACPFVCNSFQAFVNKLPTGNGAPNSAPSKRLFIDSISSILDTTQLTSLVHQLLSKAQSDETEQQCETQCMAILNNALLDTACPFVCNSLKEIAARLDITPGEVPAGRKRFILDSLGINQLEDIFSTADLHKYVHMIVEIVGSDASEQQCEKACLDVMNSELFKTGCPFICSSFQMLVRKFDLEDITPSAAPVNKRFILDNFNNILNQLTNFDLDTIVNTIGDEMGSDVTEYNCEEACKDSTDLPDMLCPVLCSQFQSFAQGIHVTEAKNGTSTINKRQAA